MPILNMVWWGGWANLAEPTDLAVALSWDTATITWTDPDTVRTIPPTTFSKSVLVRKSGSAPENPSDWIVVVTETTKDTYKTTWYEDTGLTKWTEYYYRVFSYSADGGISYGDSVKILVPVTYTIVWNETSDPSQFFVRYEDDAVWMTQWSSAFDTFFWYSAVLLDWNWNEVSELKQTSPWNLKLSSLWTITWTANNVMIKFPRRWVKMTKSGSQITLSITSEPNKDWYQYYAFTKWTAAKDYLYLWAFMGTFSNDNSTTASTYTDWTTYLKSWATSSFSQDFSPAKLNANSDRYWRNHFINATWKNGDGYMPITWYAKNYIASLYMLKYWNPNSQTIVWKWYTSWSSVVAPWWTKTQTLATYWTSSGTQQVKLFWLEDWWWNCWSFMNGIKSYKNESMNRRVYAVSKTNVLDEGQRVEIPVGYWLLSWWASSVVWDNDLMFLLSAKNWTETTYYTDSYWNSYPYYYTSWWQYNSWTGAWVFSIWNVGSYENIRCRLMYL